MLHRERHCQLTVPHWHIVNPWVWRDRCCRGQPVSMWHKSWSEKKPPDLTLHPSFSWQRPAAWRAAIKRPSFTVIELGAAIDVACRPPCMLALTFKAPNEAQNATPLVYRTVLISRWQERPQCSTCFLAVKNNRASSSPGLVSSSDTVASGHTSMLVV